MSTYDKEPNPEDFGPEPPHIANAFNTKGPSQLGKHFKPRNDKPGKLTPMVLPGTPTWQPPKE